MHPLAQIWSLLSDDSIEWFRHSHCMDNCSRTYKEIVHVPAMDYSRTVDRNPLSMLSSREIDVVQELVDGHSTDAAAAALFISRHTFRTHVKNISRKLDTHSSLELVSLAVEFGMRPSRCAA